MGVATWNRFTASPRRLDHTAVLSFVALAAFLLYAAHPLLATGLRPVDDHEYLSFRLINPSGSPWTAWLDAMFYISAEFEGARWRPSYQFGRAVTTAFISDWAAPRYALRLALTAFVVWGIALRLVGAFAPYIRSASLRFLAIVTAGMILFLIADWSDVSARLGPQELFALTGLTLALLALRNTPQRRHQVALLSGIVVMSSFKENFASLAVIFLVSVLAFSPLHRRQRVIYLSLAISVVSVAMSVLAVHSKGNVDFYGNQRTAATIFKSLTSFTDSARLEWSAVLLVLAFLVARREARRPVISIGSSLLVALTNEWIVYEHDMDGYGRYAVASDLIVGSLLAAVLLLLCQRLLNRTTKKHFVPFGLSLILVLITASLAVPFAKSIRGASSAAQREALSWSNAVQEVLTESTSHDAEAILIIVDISDDSEIGRLEKSVALMRFLAFYSERPRDLYLTLQALPQDSEPSEFTRKIRAGLERRSELGGVDEAELGSTAIRHQPIRNFDPNDDVLCVHYSSSGRAHAFMKSCAKSVRFNA